MGILPTDFFTDTYRESRHSIISRLPYHAPSARISLLALFLAAVGICSLVQAEAQPSERGRIAHLVAAHADRLAPGLAQQIAAMPQRAAQETMLTVIIQTDGTVPTQIHPLLRNASLQSFKAIHKSHPALVPLNTKGTLVARLSPLAIARLIADTHIVHISPDLPIHTCDTGSAPVYYDYALQAIGADYAFVNNNLTGKGITVAVIDTGIYPHNDLTTPTQRITGWKDLVNGNAKPYDDNGHGTHVGGLIAGNGSDSTHLGYNASMVRIASGATLVGVKVLDQNGAGSVSTVIAGIDWCVANQTRLGIRVLNLSVGHPIGESYTTDPMCQACERAWAAGITVVCAAGNYGRSIPADPGGPTQFGSITSPGNDPYVITVGAMNTCGTLTRSDDKICTYSSRGPSSIDLVMKPDLVAPGNVAISLAAPGSTLYIHASASLIDPSAYGGSGLSTYLTLSGTSMAAPIVAGGIALMLQADSTLTPDTIKARLMLSASKTDAMDYLSYGAGYINIIGALQLTQVAASFTTSPSVVRHSDGTVSIVNYDWRGQSIGSQNFGWGGDLPPTKGASFAWNGDTTGSTNFGWGGDLPPTKNLTNYATVENFGWGDSVFLGSGVFGGPIQLPLNFRNDASPLWTGGITSLSTPDQADALSLLFNGD